MPGRTWSMLSTRSTELDDLPKQPSIVFSIIFAAISYAAKSFELRDVPRVMNLTSDLIRDWEIDHLNAGRRIVRLAKRRRHELVGLKPCAEISSDRLKRDVLVKISDDGDGGIIGCKKPLFSIQKIRKIYSC